MDRIFTLGGVPTSLLPWLTTDHGDFKLRICSVTPYGAKNVTDICPTVYDTGESTNAQVWLPPPGFRRNVSSIFVRLQDESQTYAF